MRFARLVVALAVLACACGRTIQASVADGGSVATAGPAESPQVLEPATSDFVYLPWEGDVPVWPLTPVETEQLYAAWAGMDSMDPENPSGVYSKAWLRSNGLSDDCGDGYGDTDLFDQCLGRYFADHGATPRSIELFGRYSITVEDLETAGPIQVARVSDWGYFGGSVGMGAYFIHTPEGFLTMAGGMAELSSAAIDVASATEMFHRIAAAVGDVEGPLTFGWPGVGWGPADPPQPYGGWDGVLSAPEDLLLIDPATAAPIGARWTVSQISYLGKGCMTCSIEIASRFAIDFTAEGVPVDVRFVSFCLLPSEVVGAGGAYAADANLEEVAAIAAELPGC